MNKQELIKRVVRLEEQNDLLRKDLTGASAQIRALFARVNKIETGEGTATTTLKAGKSSKQQQQTLLTVEVKSHGSN